MKRSLTVLAALLAAIAAPASAQQFSWTAGMDYSSGKYGTQDRTEIWYFPVAGKYETGPLTLRVTVPYLRIKGDVGPENVPLQPGDCKATESGLGDIVGSAGYNLLDGTQGGGLLLDVVGKVKFPTADDPCLGTGKTDYSIQFDAAKSFGGVTGFGTLGWKKFGDPSGTNFRDPVFVTVGAAYRLAPATSLGVSYDWRQRLRANRDNMSEMTVFMSQRLDPTWRLQLYAVGGFTDASPDWGGGLTIGRSY